ncbi:hypothetical protein GCM10009678_47190 [Actinomadura kijaniata]
MDRTHALDATCSGGRLALVAGNSAPEHHEWDPASPEWTEERRRELPGHSDDRGDLAVPRLAGHASQVTGRLFTP